MSHWLVGSTWKRHRTVSSKKEENVSSSTLNSKDLQVLLCKQTNFLQLQYKSFSGSHFLIAIEDYCLRGKKKFAPREEWFITFKIHENKRQNKYLIWKRNDLETVHYGIKFYPLKIHGS